MRPRIHAESPLEQLGLWLNLVPVSAAEAMFGMGIARAVMAGQKLGVFRALARHSASGSAVANACGIDPVGARHLLRCLCALGHVSESDGVYALSKTARKWLDPESSTYVGTFLEFNYDQWEWWSGLEESLEGRQTRGIHSYPADDPYWRRYITGMFELARLTAPEVARHVKLPANAERILDVAGGHGWFAAEICRRNPRVSATVIDLPGSAKIGREIIAAAGRSDRIQHVDGDALSADLGGPYDAALCFGIIHHLSPEQNGLLFKRVAAALNPGGILAVLDMFEPPAGQKANTSAFLGLHFYLTSGASTYTEDDLKDWLADAGFTGPRRARLRSIPLETLYQAVKP